MNENQDNTTKLKLSTKYYSKYSRCDISKELMDVGLESIFSKNLNIIYILGDVTPHDLKLMNGYDEKEHDYIS